ncbi:MAG: sigma-54 dependent transcriptional regulator [Deltaproteobacteria bacterium]|nr:sigma-54 dependent transcriptional regulator [Deltaproteobacteria bacterium]
MDDEPYMLELIETLLRDNTACQTRTESDPRAVLPLLASEEFDLAFLDLRMPGMEGLELLREIKKHHPALEVVIVTAFGTIPTAVEAMQEGAADFLPKPFNKKQLLLVLDKVLQMAELRRENLALRAALARRFDLGEFVGAGPVMRELARELTSLAGVREPVFLTGEFGAGKSFVARALHHAGPWAAAPFLHLAAGAVEPGELAGLLFGREVADGRTRPGLLAQAREGSLHLDEVEALPPAVQKRLAQVCAAGGGELLGAAAGPPALARLIFSSCRSLDELLAAGSLTQELYYHLARFPLAIPPLRARREDIPHLAGAFLQKFSEAHGTPPLSLGDTARQWLTAQDWPGNLRELENTLERAVLLSRRPVIGLAELSPPDQLPSLVFSPDYGVLELPLDQAWDQAVAEFRPAFEKQYLGFHLARVRGDVARAAASLGWSAGQLRSRAARLGLLPGAAAEE